MAFHSLRARLLVIQSALVVGLTVLTLAYVSVLANRAVGERFAGDLARSRAAIESAINSRYQRLDLVAQLVGSFPGLHGLLTGTDTATIHDFLGDFRQRSALGGPGQLRPCQRTFCRCVSR